MTEQVSATVGDSATARPVTYRTGHFRALGHDFTVATSDPALGAYLDALFGSLATEEPARHAYTIVECDRPGQSEWTLDLDGRLIVRSQHPAQVLAMLLWDVNRSVVERTEGLVLLHAAAAEHAGAAVVLPGEMEAGKTTLVAGLVRAGLGYLTDEVTAIDPRTGRIRAYPKALSVDPGSYVALADLEPAVPPDARRFLPDQWQVLPAAIRRGAVARTATPRLVVLPRYVPGAPTQLRPLSRADALVAVAGCAFTFDADPPATLLALGAVLRDCACYELRSSDLGEAVTTVLDLLERAAGEPATTVKGAGA